MAKNHVLQTSAAQAMLAKMNAKAQANFVKEVASRARKARIDADTEMNNKIIEIEKTAAEALKKADVLDDFEKGQLEKAFAKFLAENGLQSVLNSMTYVVDGQPYSLASVLNMLVDTDKIAKEDFDYDDQDNLASGHYELHDGHKFDMAYTRTEPMSPDTGLPTGDVVFDGAATLRGIPVTEQFVMRPRKETQSIEGEPYEATVAVDLVSRTHITYDLMPLLQPATGIVLNPPDLNDDGVIGNPEPTPEPAVQPAEEPPVETPAEEPPVETPVEEPPVETPAEETPAETPAEETPDATSANTEAS